MDLRAPRPCSDIRAIQPSSPRCYCVAMRDDSDLTPFPRENLSGAQRWLLGPGGLVFGGIGVAAIFLAENEAGSAVALLICGVLVLVAIQGTKVQRISAGENSVDFAHV